MHSSHLAIDLGASSGRAVLGRLEASPLRLRIEEVHRFEHRALDLPGGPVWDYTGIVGQVLECVRRGAAAARAAGVELVSVGVDSWAVDWSVIAPSGDPVGLPRCYRDPAHIEASRKTLERLGGAAALYARNGIQPLPFNTLFQLFGQVERAPELVPSSGTLLMLPDMLHHVLCGAMVTERTNASSGAWLTAGAGEWDLELFNQLGLPTDLLAPIVDPGAKLGKLRPLLAESLGAPAGTEVIAPATHDTASAIAAVPAVDRPPQTWAYLSSGTWSLLGMELRDPILSPEALKAGFTNELGLPRDGKPTVRFLRNIGGLWLIQELQRDLLRQGTELSHAELVTQAEQAEPFRTLVDPNNPTLAQPGGSMEKLRRLAEATGQPAPETPGQFTRCCLESLALSYAETITDLERLTGRTIEALYAVGGGAQNGLLNRLTAAAIDRPLVAGPIEASAIGNLLIQAIGQGSVADGDQLRRIVADSFAIETIPPDNQSASWLEPRERFMQISKGARVTT